MARPPTVVVDIDGVLATGTPEDVYSNEAGWAYEKCVPLNKGIRMLNEIRCHDASVRIILFTARWEQDREKTQAWLEKYEVPFDQLLMGKPSADLYIDDKNFPLGFRPDQVLHADGLTVLTSIQKNREGTHADWMFEETRRAPCQGSFHSGGKPAGSILWSEHEAAWGVYAARYGKGQSAERLAERGGFSWEELISFLGHEPKTWQPRKKKA